MTGFSRSAVDPSDANLETVPGPGEPQPGTNPSKSPEADVPHLDPASTEAIGVPTMPTSFPASMLDPDPTGASYAEAAAPRRSREAPLPPVGDEPASERPKDAGDKPDLPKGDKPSKR